MEEGGSSRVLVKLACERVCVSLIGMMCGTKHCRGEVGGNKGSAMQQQVAHRQAAVTD